MAEEKQEEEEGGLEDEEDTTIVLISGEESPSTFTVEREYSKMSGLIQTILEGDPMSTRIVLKRYNSKSLETAVKYFNIHKGVRQSRPLSPLRSEGGLKEIVKDERDVHLITSLSIKELFGTNSK